VEIHVLQGERPMAKDNRSLGRFHLDGIMPAPRGVPQIEVTLDIDANGILSVSAKDKATGKENKIRIEGGSQLSKEEIERMKQEAAENAESDKIERERIDKLNQADSLIFQTEKQIKEFGDKLTEENTTELNACLETLKSAHSAQNLEEIDSDMNKLNETWQRISTDLYSRASSENGDTTSSGDAEDVQFEEVK
jgi:molecular chaperone DnaK